MPTKRINTKVVGVTHRNLDQSSRQAIIRKLCRPGMRLALIPEPDNPYSKWAIGVWLDDPNLEQRHQIGYVRDELARDLSRRVGKHASLAAWVTDVTGGGRGESFGVNIEIEIADYGEVDFEDDEPRRSKAASETAASAKSGKRQTAARVAKAKSGRGRGGCLAFALLAFLFVGILKWLPERKPEAVVQPAAPRIEEAPKPDPPRVKAPKVRQNRAPAQFVEPPKPLIEEAPEPVPEPVGPPKPRHSTRAATMLQSSRNIAKLGNREGAIASYRDVVIKFPDTIEAAEALAELKRLGGEPPSPEEIKPVE